MQRICLAMFWFWIPEDGGLLLGPLPTAIPDQLVFHKNFGYNTQYQEHYGPASRTALPDESQTALGNSLQPLPYLSLHPLNTMILIPHYTKIRWAVRPVSKSMWSTRRRIKDVHHFRCLKQDNQCKHNVTSLCVSVNKVVIEMQQWVPILGLLTYI